MVLVLESEVLVLGTQVLVLVLGEKSLITSLKLTGMSRLSYAERLQVLMVLLALNNDE